MPLELALVKLLIVQRAETWRQAAQRSHQPELRGDDVDDEAEACSSREIESILDFALRLAERVSGREQVGIQVVATIGRKGVVADLVRGLDGAAHQITAA